MKFKRSGPHLDGPDYPGAWIRSVNLISFISDVAGVTRAEAAHDARPRRYRTKRMRETLRHINVY